MSLLLWNIQTVLNECFVRLGGLLLHRYAATGSAVDLDEATGLAVIVSKSSLEDETKLEYMEQTGLQLSNRYSSTKCLEDLNTSVSLLKQVVNATAPAHPQWASRVNNFAIQLGMRYATTRVIEDISHATDLLWKVVNFVSPDTPSYITYLNNLGHGLGFKYTATKAPADLEKTIQVLRKGFEITPVDDPSWPTCVNNLGIRLGERYELTLALGDLDEAIQMSRAAIEATPSYHPDRVRRLHNLGLSLSKRYLASKVQADLDEAIDMLREAVTISPPGCRERAEWFTNLGNVMSDRYALTKSDQDLDQSIQMLRKGLQAAPNHPAKSVWLNNLGLCLAGVYARSGALSDLEEAIQMARLSLDATALQDSERTNRLINLGSRLCTRHLRTGALADLEQGISIFQRAIIDTPPDDRERAGRLNNLGVSLADKYLRTQRLEDLEEAIKTLREAVGTSKMGHPIRATCLSNLGNNLAYKYAVSGSVEDLEEAVAVSQQAVDATPKGHHAMSERLCNVALRLKDKYLRTSQMEDISEAISISEEALGVCPLDHPIRAACLDTVGIALRERCRKTGRRQDWEQARDSFASAVSVTNSAVSVRIKAGRRYLSLPGIASDPEAYKIARSVISLIPLLTPRSLQNVDKRHLLSEAVGMASDAAAIALQAGQSAVAAIECLETGRGVIAGAFFEQHDISMLKRTHPDLAEAFVNIRDRLDQPSMKGAGLSILPDYEDIDPATLTQMERCSRQEAAESLASLLKQIRSEASFERCLLPVSETEMLDAARDGPIVIVNVSSHRSDALIVERSGIRSLPLPLVSPERIDDHAVDMRTSRTLEWLWDAIASPVLDALKLVAPGCAASRDKWPRVWWILTGRLSKFPIHAAGYHLHGNIQAAGTNVKTVLDRVISSYSASIKALIHGRRQQGKVSRLTYQGPPKTLVCVAMRHTPGRSSLIHAETEVDTVFQVLDSSALEHSHPPAYRQDVLAAIANCEIFHFAGHGSTNATEPLQSMLLLNDWCEAPFTVSSLLKLKIASSPPLLAYLSACGSSEIRNESSTDESLHLVNACQLTGFRHVIGTLWSVDDEICVEMARLVYENLDDLDDEAVSWGLHNATRTLRDQWVHETMNNRAAYDEDVQEILDHRGTAVGTSFSPGQPLWAPYVHFGV